MQIHAPRFPDISIPVACFLCFLPPFCSRDSVTDRGLSPFLYAVNNAEAVLMTGIPL